MGNITNFFNRRVDICLDIKEEEEEEEEENESEEINMIELEPKKMNDSSEICNSKIMQYGAHYRDDNVKQNNPESITYKA